MRNVLDSMKFSIFSFRQFLAINKSCENSKEDLDLTHTIRKVSGCENFTKTEVFESVNSDVRQNLTSEEISNFVH